MPELTFPYLNISIEESTGLLYSEWLREPQHDEYLKGMNQLAECLKRYPIIYWIQDSTHLIHIPLETQRQALRQMVPAVTNSHIKKIARIVALGFAYIAMFDQVVEEEQTKAEKMQLLVDRNIEVQQFRSYQEAADWIANFKL
jgi:hypothetical protein